MQALLSPAVCSGGAPPALPPSALKTSSCSLRRAFRPPLSLKNTTNLSFSLSSFPFSSSNAQFCSSSSSSAFQFYSQNVTRSNGVSPLASASVSAAGSTNDESEKDKLAQVSKRLESTSRYFKRLGSLGFWGQLVCTIVGAVILSFSIVANGNITTPVTFYATAGGIVAAFISVFWSFGYIRLSNKLRRTANEPSKAPPRAGVVRNLQKGIVINILGMGAALLGMQATVGLLVGKALTSTGNPYYQAATISAGNSPVLALDVFLVQASANTVLSHFLGLVFSLELLRSVTLPSSERTALPPPPVPKVA